MTRYGLVCLLIALAWGQAATSRPGETQQNPAATSTPAQPQPPAAAQEAQAAAKAAQVPPDAAVITIKGLCPSSTPAKTSTADCKTVITRSQFETILDAIQPNLPPRVRRQFATRYANALVLSQRAEEMGLDRGPDFAERMKLQRIQVLAMELNKALQDKASQITDQEIQDYYHANLDKFVQVDVDRIYVPKTQQRPAEQADAKDKGKDKEDKDADAGEKPSGAEEQKRQQDSEQTMKNEADKLRARAAAGDNFTQLQEEAFRVAGVKSNATNVSLGKMRRAALPPSHALIMDLKAGQISPVIADQGGYFIYRVKSVDTMPLDQAKEEIKGTLRSQHLQDENRQVQQSATASFDEAYFGPELPPPSPRGPGARPAGQPSRPSGPN